MALVQTACKPLNSLLMPRTACLARQETGPSEAMHRLGDYPQTQRGPGIDPGACGLWPMLRLALASTSSQCLGVPHLGAGGKAQGQLRG